MKTKRSFKPKRNHIPDQFNNGMPGKNPPGIDPPEIGQPEINFSYSFHTLEREIGWYFGLLKTFFRIAFFVAFLLDIELMI